MNNSKDRLAEIRRHEAAINGRGKPLLSPVATLGRLAELYLQTPREPGLPEKALKMVRAGMTMVSSRDPLYPKLRHFEAMALRHGSKDAATWAQAAAIDHEAWRSTLETAPREAILLAAEWGDWAWAEEIWEQAGEAYSNARRALYRHLTRHVIDDTERLDLLENFRRIATRGAYAFGRVNNPKDAIIVLERASDLAIGVNQQRWALGIIEKTHPALHGRLQEKWVLQHTIHSRDGFDSFGNISEAERNAQTEVDQIVNQVRAIPGFASFAAPSNWSDVEAASIETPLVYLVATDKGSAVFVVLPGSGHQRKVAVVNDVPATIEEIYMAAKDFIELEEGAKFGDRFLALETLLEWLSRITLPIRIALKEANYVDKPFVILTFGILSQFPFHATFWRPEAPNHCQYHFHPKYVSFAYSARSLVECRRRAAQPHSPTALIVNNPQPLPATYSPLVLSDFEAGLVAKHVPDHRMLVGPEVTTPTVTTALPGRTLIHFICHGTVDKRMKYCGILLLAKNQVYTYRHIRGLKDLDARLVVLSACRSGTAAPTIEHVLNLPSAFLSAGAAAVLGTFWHSDEMASLLLLTKFYELWIDRTRSPVLALGDAQEWLMNARADALRAVLPKEALQSPAARLLSTASSDDYVYRHPWYWAGFFIAGA